MMGFAVNGREPGSPEKPSVLVTGATGYIGGRLVPVLEAAGVRLRCLARQPAALASRVSPATEVVAGDLLDPGHSIARSRESTSPITSCTPWGARRLRRNRSHRCPQFRRSGAARRDSPDRAPRRPRDGRRGIQQASQEPDRNRRGAARKRRPRRGVSRVGRHRVRKPLVRGDPRARRTLPVMICPRWVSTWRSRSASTTCSPILPRRCSCPTARAGRSKSAVPIRRATAM